MAPNILRGVDMSQAVDEIRKLNDDLKKVANEALSKARPIMSAKELREMEKSYSGISKQMIAAVKSGNELQQKALEKRMKEEEKHYDGIISKRMDAIKKMEAIQNKGVSERIDSLTSGLQSAFQTFQSGDLAGAITGAGGKLKGAGGKAQVLGKGIQAKGAAKGSGAMAGMGGLIASLGPLLTTIGAVVGAIGALAAAIIAIDSRFKQLNDNLIKSGATLGDLTSDLNAGNEAFDTFRQVSEETSMSLMITREQVNELTAGLTRGGMAFKEITKGAKSAEQASAQFSEVASEVVDFSRLMGMGFGETAEKMALQAEALGTDLKGVGDRFGAVYEAAMQSGFGVKRFFNVVLQAVSGVTLYTKRIEEAASMLSVFGEILGQEMGAQMLQNLNQSMNTESFTESAKRVMVTGQKTTQKIAEGNAGRAAEDFVSAFSSKLEGMGPGASGKFAQAFKDMGITGIDFGGLGSDDAGARQKTSEQMVQALKGLDPKKQAQLIAKIRVQDPEVAARLNDLVDASKATAGGLGALAGGMDTMDMTSKLTMQLEQTRQVLGKPLYELDKSNLKQMAAAQQITGLGREQLVAFMEIGRGMSGNFAELQDIAKKGGVTDADRKKQIEAFGAYVDENGKIVAGKLDETADKGFKPLSKPLENVNDYIANRGNEIKEAIEEPQSAQEAAADAVRSNTQDIAEILKIGVDFYLSKIYGVLTEIYGLISVIPTLDADQAKQRAAMIRESDQEVREQAKAVTEAQNRLKDLQEQNRKAKTPEERLRISKEMTKVTGEIEAAKRGQTQAKKKKKVQQEFEGVSTDATDITQWLAAPGFVATKAYALLGQTEFGLPSDVQNKDMMGVEILRQKSEEMFDKEFGELTEEELAELEEQTGYSAEQVEHLAALNETYNRVAREAEKFDTKARRDLQDFQKKELSKSIAEEIDKTKLMRTLTTLGYDRDEAGELADKIAAEGALPEEVRQRLGEGQGAEIAKSGSAGSFSSYFGPKQDDFLLRVDGQGRVYPLVNMSARDNLAVVGTRSGGAASQAARGARGGAGGGGAVHNHFYNDARANYVQTKRVLKKMNRGG